MSFYLDDYPDDDENLNKEICPHCSGRDFYEDPVTGTLTCSSCYTASQTATQEEIDIGDGLELAAMSGGRRTKTRNSGGEGGGRGGKTARDLREYDRSKRLPDAESCCLAFQWLLWDASKCVAKLIGMSERRWRAQDEYLDFNNMDRPHFILELTVKRIWFAYLRSWTEGAAVYSAKYPEMRVSFRDLFLEDTRRSVIARHLSVTVGKRVEKEIISEMQLKLQSDPHGSGVTQSEDASVSSVGSISITSTHSPKAGSNYSSQIHPNDTATFSSTTKTIRKRRAILSIPKLCNRVFKSSQRSRDQSRRRPNGTYEFDSHQAALKIQPSLTLLLSILHLALMHLQTGIAPYHLTAWVANGLLPHALNGYALLPLKLKDRMVTIKKFFIKSVVPPADVVDDLAFLVAAAIGWYGGTRSFDDGDMPRHHDDEVNQETSSNASDSGSSRKRKHSSLQLAATSIASSRKRVHGKDNGKDSNPKSYTNQSLYNVPLLTARMVQDLDFGQEVLNNALALMGLKLKPAADAKYEDGENDTTYHHVLSLPSASLNKLYTPLHVASVIVVACKLCHKWETWKIRNLHSDTSNSVEFVPWNDTELHLLGNGPTLDYYVDFLENTALNGLECSGNVARFFESIERVVTSQSDKKQYVTVSEPRKSLIDTKVMPNHLLSGAPNPNELFYRSQTASFCHTNNAGLCSTYKMQRRFGEHFNSLGSRHPEYLRLIEYVCYTIEETNPAKLHSLVTNLENEMLMFRKDVH
ncbi:hypothetical protein ACHAW6_014635 [Cyclotella cf. meneghiniana]